MRYLAYGFQIESEMSLSEVLVAVEEEGALPPDIVVHKGKCPLWLAQEHNPTELEDGNLLVYWPHVGGFWMREGREIVIEPAQRVAEDLLRAVLLGPVLAMLLFQRGFLVLHASAVALRQPDGSKRAVAFLGHSTQGKSTMATAMFKQGHQVLADDITAVPVEETSTTSDSAHESSLLVHPALPHLKLRVPSIKALGENLEDLSLWHPKEDGYVIPLSDKFSLSSAPLQSIYVLQEGESISLRQLQPSEALTNLLDHCYCIRSIVGQQVGSDFLKCAELIRQIPVFLLQRPKDFQLLPEVARRVEEHQAFLASN